MSADEPCAECAQFYSEEVADLALSIEDLRGELEELQDRLADLRNGQL